MLAHIIKKDKSMASRELKHIRNARGGYSRAHARMLADIRKERLRRERTFTGEVRSRINRCMRRGKSYHFLNLPIQ